MKLIYVKIPVIEMQTKAYVVEDEADLMSQIFEDNARFDATMWYAKPEKTKDGKELKFHELNEH